MALRYRRCDLALAAAEAGVQRHGGRQHGLRALSRGSPGGMRRLPDGHRAGSPADVRAVHARPVHPSPRDPLAPALQERGSGIRCPSEGHVLPGDPCTALHARALVGDARGSAHLRAGPPRTGPARRVPWSGCGRDAQVRDPRAPVSDASLVAEANRPDAEAIRAGAEADAQATAPGPPSRAKGRAKRPGSARSPPGDGHQGA